MTLVRPSYQRLPCRRRGGVPKLAPVGDTRELIHALQHLQVLGDAQHRQSVRQEIHQPDLWIYPWGAPRSVYINMTYKLERLNHLVVMT